MSDFKLIPSTGEPNPEDKEALRQGMLSYHQSKGKVWGGVIVAFEWNGVEIVFRWLTHLGETVSFAVKIYQSEGGLWR